jgi:NAD(P)-dependent dehydrogenase (short-subunit alcohol dehydrogenase family)
VKNGAKVYISSRTAKDCDVTAAELNALGPGQCIPIPADLQKLEEVEKLVKAISSKEKVLHILVNNAGAAWAAGVDDYPDSAFTKVLTLNLQRVFTLTQKLLPLLRAAALQSGREGSAFKDPARIINIGSVEGLGVPDHETYAYSASKAALHHLSRALGGRLGWEGIVSNTIACGPFQSKMTAHTLASIGDVLVASNPSQRIGTPEDVAGTALFLASRAGAYVNGATITLDGGSLVAIPSSKL